MSYYFIGRLKVENPSWVEEYVPITQSLVAKHGGKYLVSGGEFEGFEAIQNKPDAMVMLEFPTKEAALAWYTDPEYQKMIELRQTGSTLDLMLVQGVEQAD